jgi:transcriptional regulator with XRE-family HTH domain
VAGWCFRDAHLRIHALQTMSRARYIPPMERTPPPRPANDRHNQAREFAAWLRDRMTSRGYDLSPRGGGRRRLAEQTGLGTTTISRILNGDAHNPDPDSLRRIAETLSLPFGETLIRAGVLTPEELGVAQSTPIDRPSITPEQAADDLGIVDPVAVRLFVAQVEAARQLQDVQTSDRRSGQ